MCTFIYVLINCHCHRILADVINSSCCQGTLVPKLSILNVSRALFGKRKEWVAWTKTNIVVATILCVDTSNIVFLKWECLCNCVSHNSHNFHVCQRRIQDF